MIMSKEEFEALVEKNKRNEKLRGPYYEENKRNPPWWGAIYPLFLVCFIGYVIYFVASNGFSLKAFAEVGLSMGFGYIFGPIILIIIGYPLRKIIKIRKSLKIKK